MSRLPKINYELVDKAREIVSSCSDINELKKAQAVLLPAIMGATLEQTALILGVSRASVPRLQKRFRLDRNMGESPKQKWGGKRRELMTVEEEKEFLLPWEEKAETGGNSGSICYQSRIGSTFGKTGKTVRSLSVIRAA